MQTKDDEGIIVYNCTNKPIVIDVSWFTLFTLDGISSCTQLVIAGALFGDATQVWTRAKFQRR